MNQRNIAKFLLVSASFLTLEVSVARADEMARDTTAEPIPIVSPVSPVAPITQPRSTQSPQRYEGPLDQRTIDPREFQRR
ncbi:hypothetical protein OYT13_23475 [Pandoraea sp. XJJ-1]|uniref:Uncharacterized protein n=1 Tax=Pandoraea cepalis TaxID=2508294 RepID=A0A5E4Y729_9BURK|nr:MULTISPECIES: hypothetical protein [Pandoraea]MBN9114440.1 hypothetical protein [Pandoraea sp.]MDN4576512.1 hypothetical protein [Pandoraea cepalis]MDN4578558.1 hypothetical protein [Pandoraea cepalis]OJY21925.1 MAG: hypothetical protein BGP02_00070 [Pandoraea sp. 64-18]WAL82673.1 hypothetical protein OYT13_23475 [Pandoraea sp. XJJ-1]